MISNGLSNSDNTSTDTTENYTSFIILSLCVAAVKIIRDLNIVLWIPVRVKDDDGVSSCQVDSKSASSRAQQKHKLVGVRLTEAIDGFLSKVTTNATVNPLVQIAKHRHTYLFK